MSKCDVKQNALCKSLGPDYRILYIDLKRCIYRDFGNGFDVEISGTHTTSNRKTATVYLWYVPEKKRSSALAVSSRVILGRLWTSCISSVKNCCAKASQAEMNCGRSDAPLLSKNF